MRRCLPLPLVWGVLCLSALLHADSPAFDLAGPKVDVHVKRGEVSLPVSQVANLLPGDRIWIHPDLPESQSAHFVLVVAFLRGATNPPPLDWFTRVETWTHAAREEGVFVTVPQEAQQALIFLAPETGGDFSTLRKAVHDRPGAFVRAAQDLQAASWDRMRLDAYLSDVRLTSQVDQKALKEKAELSARSLGIKLDQQCFDKPTDQQAPCLTAHTEGMVLDDANVQSVVSQITTGAGGDLMNQLSYSQMGGAGQFSPYIGAIVDTAKILSSLHTAHFQYIPALALPSKDTLNLRLNVPPSFRDPKSVVVVALPPVGPSKVPPLHPANNTEIQCAQKPGIDFPAEGAPMVFSTDLAHDLKLHIESSKGGFDVPVTADSSKGALVPSAAIPDLPNGELTAVLHGKWGFDDWEGPRFHLISAGSQKWSVAADDESALIVGRDDTLHIQGESTVCVAGVDLSGATPLKLPWKSPKPDLLEVAVPMKQASPGPLTVEIHQYGVQRPDTVSLNAYAEAASLDRISLNVGDKTATLKGTRLDEVAKATLTDITWTPDKLTRVQDFDQLTMSTDAPTNDLETDSHYSASVLLRDGRQLKVPVHVEPPRPQVTLLSKGEQDDSSPATSPVHLGSADDLPISGKIVFFLKSLIPQKFPRNQKIEVAAADDSFKTVLSLADGSLLLEDSRTALGTVEPLARFGPSAFGPVRARAVSADGVAGDWMPLGTLVRLPGFKDLHCPHIAAKACILGGNNLFLVESVSASADFTDPIEVPADYTAAQLAVPHPANGTLYFKLRDDPETVQTLNLPVTFMPGSAAAVPSPAAASSPSPAGTPAPAASVPPDPPAAKPVPQT
ncbi:hypothetical protein DYQ86_07870 [Acidobacteria bacterium AB60]|nr:hypothetical protein DYQ86_07870 [Acidobacteria bacterium AB60]